MKLFILYILGGVNKMNDIIKKQYLGLILMEKWDLCKFIDYA